jgi:hypothetical protein
LAYAKVKQVLTEGNEYLDHIYIPIPKRETCSNNGLHLLLIGPSLLTILSVFLAAVFLIVILFIMFVIIIIIIIRIILLIHSV